MALFAQLLEAEHEQPGHRFDVRDAHGARGALRLCDAGRAFLSADELTESSSHRDGKRQHAHGLERWQRIAQMRDRLLGTADVERRQRVEHAGKGPSKRRAQPCKDAGLVASERTQLGSGLTAQACNRERTSATIQAKGSVNRWDAYEACALGK